MKNIGLSISALPFDRVARHPDLVLAFLVASVIAVLIIPVPAEALDVLLAANVTLSALVLAAVLLSERALAISSFPTLLLLTTLFRLTLNVSTTRLILSKGDAGTVVRAFGDFVLQGDVVVGLVIFAIITLVQFLVIAKGAERVAEVGARFTLDALPGKQMAIEGALRAGELTEEQAAERREELGRESQFFGAMDGAMKFVKGDAIAGLIITFINLVAGLAIGWARFDLPLGRAAELYSVLTVGDGLVSQIPALLITLAAGVLVTRVSGGGRERGTSLGASLRSELLSNPKVLGVGATFALLLALVPGLPGLPFGVLALALALVALRRHRVSEQRVAESKQRTLAHLESTKAQLAERAKQAQAQRAVTDQVVPGVVMAGLHLGEDLTEALLERGGAEGDLLTAAMQVLREGLYQRTGIQFPALRIVPRSPEVPAGAVAIHVKEVPIAMETLDLERAVVLESADRLRRLGLPAEPVRVPGCPAACLVPRALEVTLAEAGIPARSLEVQIIEHAQAVLLRHARLFVGMQEVAHLVQRLEKTCPDLVKEVLPKLVSLAQLTDILRRLADEGVSIRDLRSIFEALAEQGPHHTDNVVLTEAVRSALALQLGHSFAGRSNRLPVLLLDEVIEETVRGGIHHVQGGSYVALEPELRRAIIAAVQRSLTPVLAQGVRPIVLTHSDIRRYVRKLLEHEVPACVVLSFQELPAELTLQPLGRVELPDDLAVAA